MYFYKDLEGKIHPKADIRVKMAGGPEIFFNSKFVASWWHEKGDHEILKTAKQKGDLPKLPNE